MGVLFFGSFLKAILIMTLGVFNRVLIIFLRLDWAKWSEVYFRAWIVFKRLQTERVRRASENP